MTEALLVLEGDAMQMAREEVALRVSHHGSGLVLDLGRPDGLAAVVSAGGWSVGPSPVLFRRTALTDPLPDPAEGGDWTSLWGQVNIDEADRPLVIAWLVTALLPQRPCPVLALVGEQGTAKTTSGRLLASIVDSPDALRAPPRDEEGWIVAANSSRIIGLDNVSRIQPWLSDLLCRTVTGEALVRRKLYTDADVTRVSLRRPIIVTSIDPGALRGDLAERLLTIELRRIDDAARQTDAEIQRRWLRAQPSVLGALLDVTAQVLKVLPSINLARLPRMADYAQVLGAVDQVMGTQGLPTYLGQGRSMAADVIESDPVATRVRDFMSMRTDWEGTAGVLLNALTPTQPPKNWPTTARGMSGALKRCAPALRTVGVTVEHPPREGGSGRRLLRVTRDAGGATVTTVTPPDGYQVSDAQPPSAPGPSIAVPVEVSGADQAAVSPDGGRDGCDRRDTAPEPRQEAHPGHPEDDRIGSLRTKRIDPTTLMAGIKTANGR